MCTYCALPYGFPGIGFGPRDVRKSIRAGWREEQGGGQSGQLEGHQYVVGNTYDSGNTRGPLGVM